MIKKSPVGGFFVCFLFVYLFLTIQIENHARCDTRIIKVDIFKSQKKRNEKIAKFIVKKLGNVLVFVKKVLNVVDKNRHHFDILLAIGKQSIQLLLK